MCGGFGSSRIALGWHWQPTGTGPAAQPLEGQKTYARGLVGICTKLRLNAVVKLPCGLATMHPTAGSVLRRAGVLL